MPNTRIANAVRLEFAPGSLVQANLSGAAFVGDWVEHRQPSELVLIPIRIEQPETLRQSKRSTWRD